MSKAITAAAMFLIRCRPKRKLKLFIGIITAVFITFPTVAADIGKLNQKEPDLTVTSKKTIFEIERCIIEIDALGIPSVYRQPDQPDKTQIAYSLGTGVPLLIALMKLEDGSKIEIRRGTIGLRKPGLPPMLNSCF